MEEDQTAIKWAYCRVSTQDQDLGRQIEAMKQLGIHEKYIITEKIQGLRLL